MSASFKPNLLSVNEARSRARRGSVSLKALPIIAAPPPPPPPPPPNNTNNNKSNGTKETKNDKNDDKNKFKVTARDLNAATDDLVALETPSIDNILSCLKERYMKSTVYTNVGRCLLSVNPYEWIVGLYDKNVAAMYQNASGGDTAKKMKPHVFGIAANAYHALKTGGNNQSILITGESGAGKTENTKKCIQYLVDVAAPGSDLEAQILSTNPILEAFGNSKTCRNNNSSRFGKWIEIKFNTKNKIANCSIVTYLLEKSRVAYQPDGERNYHIFHMICKAGGDKLKERLKLNYNNDYNFVSNDGIMYDSSGIDDTENYEDFVSSVQNIGWTNEMQENIFKIVAGILHLGNISFIEQDSQIASISIAERSSKGLENAAEMFNIDNSDALRQCLCTRTIKVRSSGEEMQVPMNVSKSVAARDALAKDIYSRLFDYIVEKLNVSLSNEANNSNVIKSCIGVLDIFGFEIFENNKFEQLCINYVNEKLQYFYNLKTFEEEESLYKKEGVSFKHVEFPSNELVLNLFDKKITGIFSVLDEEGIRPSGNDKSFRVKLNQKNKSNTSLRVSKIQNELFTVRHFAGTVTYACEGFVVMNRDRLLPSLLNIMKNTKNDILNKLYKRPMPASKKGGNDAGKYQKKSKSNLSLTGKLKTQVTSLLKMLNETSPHFIRCVKPNNECKSKFIDDKLVKHQLQCLGVVNALEIQQRGFPMRLSYKEFVKEYKFSAFGSKVLSYNDMKDGARQIIDKLSESDSQLNEIVFGKSKIFYKPSQAKILTKMRIEAEYTATVKVQSFIRQIIAYKNVYLKYVKIRNKLRSYLKLNFEKVVVDIDAFEKCINRALRYGRKGWKEVKEGNAIIVLVRQRQSVGLRLKNLLANWAKEGAAALGDEHLPALDRAVANAHKLNLGNIERYHPLISQAMSIQLSARERQNIRDELSNSIYNSDFQLLQQAIKRTENGRKTHGDSFCSELLRKAKDVIKEIQREKSFINKLLDALRIGSCCNEDGNFDKEHIEFDHLSSAVLVAKNEYLKTPLAKRMIQHAQYITELRIAAVTDDWGKVGSIVKTIKGGQQQGGNISDTSQHLANSGKEHIATEEELICIEKELEDIMLCSNIIKALSRGGIVIDAVNKVGESNIERIVQTVELETLIREATIHINKSNTKKSRKTKVVYDMAHHLLRIRLALKSMDWSYLDDGIKTLEKHVEKDENLREVCKDDDDFLEIFKKELENCKAELRYRIMVQNLEETFDEGILSVEQDINQIVFVHIDEVIDEAVASGYTAQYFADLLISVRHSRNIRASLKSKKWNKVRMVLARATHHAAMYNSPKACDVELKVINAICACHEFLSLAKDSLLHGCFIVVDDGPMDMNSIEHDHLDEVIAKGEMLSDVTVEARKYLSTVIIIRQFRDALKKQNWSAVQKLLSQSFFTGTIPKEVISEVDEAKRMLKNVLTIDALKKSLLRGMAKNSSVTKIFDPNNIEITHIETQINLAVEISEERRFVELKQLIPFAQFVCELRRSLMSSSWDTVVHLLERIVLPGNVEHLKNEIANSSSTDDAPIKTRNESNISTISTSSTTSTKRSSDSSFKKTTTRRLSGNRRFQSFIIGHTRSETSTSLNFNIKRKFSSDDINDVNAVLALERYPFVNAEIKVIIEEVERRSVCALLSDALSSNRLRMANLIVEASTFHLTNDVTVQIDCSWERPRALLDPSNSAHKSLERSNSVVDQALSMMMLYDEDQVLFTKSSESVLEKLKEAVEKAAYIRLTQPADELLLRSAKAMLSVRIALCDGDYHTMKEAIHFAEHTVRSPLVAAELQLAASVMKTQALLYDVCNAIMHGCAILNEGGSIDVSKIEIAHLEKVVKEAEEKLESHTNKIISISGEHVDHSTFEQAVPYVKAARLVLRLRHALVADDMEEVSKCCEESLQTEELPLIVQSEIQTAKREANLRLILENITAAMSSGSAVGKTGEVDVSSLYSRHLEAAISKAERLCRNIDGSTKVLEMHIQIAIYILKIRRAWISSNWKDMSLMLDECNTYLCLDGVKRALLNGVGIPQTSIDELKAASKECEFRLMLKELNISSARGRTALDDHGSVPEIRKYAKALVGDGSHAFEFLDRKLLIQTLAAADRLGIRLDNDENIRILTALPENAFMEVKLKKALEKNDAGMVAEVTVDIKSKQMEGLWEQFRLDKYPGLTLQPASYQAKEFQYDAIGDSKKDDDINKMDDKAPYKLKWTKNILEKPLTKLSFDNYALGIKISKYILGYMHDRYYPYPLGCLNELVKLGYAFPSSRDEIYCQLCKQLTDNTSSTGFTLGWNAFFKCLECFPPSKAFENYVEYFLRINNRIDLVLLMHKIVYLEKTSQLIAPNLEMLHGM